MIRVTDGTIEPISYAVAKEAFRLDDETDEATVNLYVKAAREAFEMHTRCITTSAQTWKAQFNYWHNFKLLIYPVLSISSVQYYDADDSLQTYASSNYWEQTYSNYTIIELKPTASKPALSKRSNSIIVNFTVGHTTPATVPSQAKAAILSAAGHFYANRQAVVAMSGVAAVELPLGYRSIVEIMKIWN